MATIGSVPLTALTLFGIGLGWSMSYVSATAILSEAASPSGRAGLLGFSDLIAGFTGAGLALIGGLGLATSGLTVVALGAAALPALAGIWIVAGLRAHTEVHGQALRRAG